MTSLKKLAANRRNAQSSTGPRTAAGKAAASLNARRHGLNTPVPDDLFQACLDQHKALLDFARVRSHDEDLSDLIYALAARDRLRQHRAGLVEVIVTIGTADELAPGSDRVREALGQLRRLETYERKSRSRLASLLGPV